MLKALGICNTDSARYQWAAIPSDDEFHEWTRQCDRDGIEITQKNWSDFVVRFDPAPNGSAIRRPFMSVVSLEQRVALGERYGCVLLTPNWQSYEHAARMTYQELSALPVGRLADTSAQIHLWIPSQHLDQGLCLLKHWEFRYVDALSCASEMGSYGPYYRQDVYHLIAGLRGDAGFRAHGVSNWQRNLMQNGKPDERVLRERLIKIAAMPFLHLFGSEMDSGWTVDLLRRKTVKR